MASKGINRVILVGHLGQDPEVRYMPNGNAVANFNIATSESWKDKQTGETRDHTEWHRIVVFGKLAEIAGQYIKKGTQVYIEGQLQTRKWQDQSGQDHYTTEVVINPLGGTLQILGSRENSADDRGHNTQNTSSRKTSQNVPAQQPKAPETPMDLSDDIPF